MTPTQDARLAAYFIILSGFGLAAAASVVPLYHTAYLLEPGILLAVLMPFLLYGLFIESLRGPWLIGAGVLLFAANLVLVVSERYVRYVGMAGNTRYADSLSYYVGMANNGRHAGYADNLIYWGPTLMAVVVLAIAYWLSRRTDEAEPSGPPSPG